MATSYVTIGSKFRPFSYDELVRPLQEATIAHQALEAEYADLDTKASIWENIANEQTDPIAHQMYKRYSEDLKGLADALASQGLTPTSRQNLLKMRSRYSQEITPIENAYNTRKALAEEQRKALAADPTLRYQRDMATTSLDDFIANPSLDYGASYSGALLTKQVAEAAKNLKDEMRNNPREWKSILGDQYYETLMTTGFSSEEVRQAMVDPENANPILVNLVDRVMNSSGVSGWASKDVYRQLRDFANQGLYSAIGETKYDTLQNRNFISDYEKWKRAHSDDPKPNEYPSQYRTASYQRTGSLYKQSLEDLAQFENFSPDKVLHVRDYNREYTVGSRTEATVIMQDYNSRVSDFENEFKENLGFDFPGDKSSKIIRNDDGSSIHIQKNNDGTFTVRTMEARTIHSPGMKPVEKDQQLTDLYNQYYREYMKLQAEGDFLKSSKIEEIAFSDKELRKMRERYGIPENTDITDYADMIRNNPEAKVENRDYVVVDAEGDTGRKYRDALTSKMFNHLVSQNPGVKIKNIGAQSIPTRGSGVYILDENFEHDKKVKNISELFTFGDDGTINNVNNYKFTPQSLSNGNMVVTVVRDGKVINAEIPLEYFGNEIAAVLYDVNPDTGISYKDSIDYYVKKGDWNSATSLTLDISNLIAPLVNYNSQTVQGETRNID